MDPMAGNVIMILCLVAGAALVILEAFIPGFGVAGAAGIILEITGVVFAWLHHGTAFAVGMTVLVLAIIAAAVWMSYRSAMKGRISKSPLILREQETTEETQDASRWKGCQGVAASALRPGGFVEIDGQRLNAASEGEWIAKGIRIVVTGFENGHVLVRPIND